MAHDVFISYSHKDKPIADAICANLENAGVRCWIAPRDIAPGLDWPTAISEAIAACRIMVLVFSANSNTSEDVGRELILAANNKLIIIPFKIENVTPVPGKQYYLARTHWLDAINPPKQEQINTLINYVKSFMGVEQGSTPITPAYQKEAPAMFTPSLPGPAKPEKRVFRKKVWLWGILLLLALAGGSYGTIYFLGNKAAPLPPEPTPSLTKTIQATETILQETSTPTEPPPVTITIWHAWSSTEVGYHEAVFDDYTAAHPTVTIVLSNYGQNWTDPLAAAIASGQGPDLIIGENGNLSASAASGNLVPLDTFGITQDWMRSEYEPVAVNSVVWDGKIWGLPVSQYGLAIIYNKALASPEDFPTDPVDFGNLRVAAENYYNSNKIPLFAVSGEGVYWMTPVLFGFGVPTFIDGQGKAYLDTPQAVNALEWYIGMKPYMLQETAYGDLMNAMEQKRVASIWNGLWAMAQLKQAGLDLGVLPFGKTMLSIRQIMLTASAVERSHAETALDIMNYYTSAEAQKKILLAAPDPDIANFIPARTAALEDPQVVALENVVAFRAAFRMGVAVMTYRGVNAFDYVDGVVMAVWNGSQTPEEALAAAQAKLEAEIAKRK